MWSFKGRAAILDLRSDTFQIKILTLLFIFKNVNFQMTSSGLVMSIFREGFKYSGF